MAAGEAGGWWRRAGLAAPRLVSAYLIFQVALNFEKVTKRHGWLAGLCEKVEGCLLKLSMSQDFALVAGYKGTATAPPRLAHLAT